MSKTKQYGVGVLEVLISVALISIAALSLVSFQAYLVHQIDYVERSQKALFLAEAKLESFRLRHSGSASFIGGYDFSTLTSGSENVSGGYSLTWLVSNGSGSVATSLKHIEISCSWTDGYQKSQAVTLNTMLSKYSEFE
ncbi:pilus assembly protein PilV [Vibrio sp. SCSIO 43136]|nr:pilus assembly protein PilV [Vibrio sp. SCSIO 43136]